MILKIVIIIKLDRTLHLLTFDWNGILKFSNINEAVNTFYEHILKIINQEYPKKYIFTPNYLLWFSGTLKNLIFKKNTTHIIYK